MDRTPAHASGIPDITHHLDLGKLTGRPLARPRTRLAHVDHASPLPMPAA